MKITKQHEPYVIAAALCAFALIVLPFVVWGLSQSQPTPQHQSISSWEPMPPQRELPIMKVGFIDETRNQPIAKAFLVKRSKQHLWRPLTADVEWTSWSFPLDEISTIEVSRYGHKGQSVSIPVVVTEELRPWGSDHSMLWVTVTDTMIWATGAAIQNNGESTIYYSRKTGEVIDTPEDVALNHAIDDFRGVVSDRRIEQYGQALKFVRLEIGLPKRPDYSILTNCQFRIRPQHTAIEGYVIVRDQSPLKKYHWVAHIGNDGIVTAKATDVTKKEAPGR